MTFPGLINTQERLGYEEGAITKLRALIESAKICMFTTSLLQWPLESRPADWQTIDERGNIWFFNGNLASTGTADSDEPVVPHVQVFYSNAGRSEFLSLIGNATISSDPESELQLIASPETARWLKLFKSDTSRQLIKFTPVEAYYWDNAYNTMIPLLRSVA